MLSKAYFLAKFRFDTAENEPAKNLQILQKNVANFFFQAEDGIRDVERSRGLGDVYKRQEVFLYFGNRFPHVLFSSKIIESPRIPRGQWVSINSSKRQVSILSLIHI